MNKTESEGIVLIGIDSAAQPRNVGLAVGRLHRGQVTLEKVVGKLSKWSAIIDQLIDWLGERTLIAIDAPLGWPAPLADALVHHRAGEPVTPTANAMFRRRTDDFVYATIGKRALDVGADRIARAAHSTLVLLEGLRQRSGLPIPLAWMPGEICSASVIEVYPAASLKARGWPDSGYKKATDECKSVRFQITEKLVEKLSTTDSAKRAMQASDHLLDAGLCVLAAADFAVGAVHKAEQIDACLRREGWIWVHRTDDYVDSQSG